MKKPIALPYHQLRKETDPKQFNFETTSEIAILTDFIGQSRALESVYFGIGIKNVGFNLFAMGPSGVGKRSLILNVLELEARRKVVPNDWCYIHNFLEPEKPVALQLPPGYGQQLRKDMEVLVEDLLNSIPIIFESDEYRARLEKIHAETSKRQDQLLKKLEEEAKKQGLGIMSSQQGIVVLPLDEQGELINLETFSKLPKEIRKEKEEMIADFSKHVATFLKEIPKLYKERRKKEKQTKEEFTLTAVGYFIDELKRKYSEFPKVKEYLDAVQHDVILNVKDFIRPEEQTSAIPFVSSDKRTLKRYEINVLVDNKNTKGAPVIHEEHPSYSNLICRLEHIAQFGAIMTDFTLIKPGTLHKANGGYLIIDALKVLKHPFAWEGLKRAIYSKKISIEPPERMVGLLSTISLDPMPIPLDIKIILLGDWLTYYLLCEHDPDFNELFKVAVDFEEKINLTPDTVQIYAELIGTLAYKHHLMAFHRTAVASIIDYSIRLAEDSEKLSTHMRSINDLMQEANFLADSKGKNIVEALDVKEAISRQIRRVDRIREVFYEKIQKNIILIDTQDKKIAQINALSYVQLGSFSFGIPTRITAKVRFGRGQVIDIQRESKLSGPIHTKAVMILSSLLSGNYLVDEHFSLEASLVFEQTYGIVEGDSASVAELCVLLSAISEIPIRQSIAVTGSINQHGEVQAIGGVNEKIEGFYDICRARGLTGTQGVLIPESNIQHLMLKEEVVSAVKAKKFHIYTAAHINEAMTILMEKPAGVRNKSGKFPKGSINSLVENRLKEFASHKKIRIVTVKKKPK